MVTGVCKEGEDEAFDPPGNGIRLAGRVHVDQIGEDSRTYPGFVPAF